MAITIEALEDWQALSAEGLGVVVDPMVVRCGELFLKGASGADEPDVTWDLLSRNLHAIAMFFDTIILEEKIPIFNYSATFDMHLDFDDRVLNTVNRDGPVLCDVSVDYLPYMEVKSAALAEVRKLYSGTECIDRSLADDILSELAAADYRWEPSLESLEHELSSDKEKKLARFFLGGLIFGAYAQLLGGSHVVQPKRSRLFLAAALRSATAGYGFEEALFVQLKERARASVTDLPWRPSFFPYLLSVADAPEGVLAEALALRRGSEVRDYRSWLAAALESWTRDGQLAFAERDVAAIAAAIDRRIGVTPTTPKVETKVTLAEVAVVGSAAAAGALGGAALAAAVGASKIDLGPSLASLWGWSFSSLPGQRYRKLLTRAIVADHHYVKIENRLATVWRRYA